MLLTMLADGCLHLSGIAELTQHLTKTNCEELLTRAMHKKKAEIKELVAEIAPKPDVPSVIRKLPVQQAKPAPQPNELRPDGVTKPAPAAPAKPAPSVVAEPLSPRRYGVHFTASAELHDKLERLSALMPGADLPSILEVAVTEKLERLEAKRFGKTKKPRKSLEEADTSPGSRGIAAPVKRFVCARDDDQCTYETGDRRRCPEREGLEFHHDDPYALGGDRGPDNIRLMCEAHNAFMAELDFGKDKMDKYRRSADRVREPQPSLQLRPDGVAESKCA